VEGSQPTNTVPSVIVVGIASGSMVVHESALSGQMIEGSPNSPPSMSRVGRLVLLTTAS